jgi:tripartite-type tricarboxylate transporter receptor subunit TctC
MLRTLTVVGTLWAILAQGVMPAVAQGYPTKPIKVVAGSAPGGGTDVLARITAEFLSKRLRQAVVVENRPGAAGSIAAQYVATSAPDGYTVYFASTEFASLPAVRKDLSYRFDNFTYLLKVFSSQPMMLARATLPVSSLRELAEYMKANPGKLRYGSTGVGGVVHLSMAGIEGAVGAKGAHVPYTGSAPIFTDMLGGFVDVTQSSPPFAEGLKVLGSVGSKRNASYPELPTLAEAGISKGTWDLWFGIVAPANLPAPIAELLTKEIEAVMEDPEAIAKFAEVRNKPDVVLGEDFRNYVMAEHAKWKAVAESERIVIQP